MWFWRKKQGPEKLETYRDWLSEAEWQEAVERIRHRPMNFNGGERRDDRSPRYETIQRCLLRVERPRKGVLGMLLVRTRNISSTGMCVVHGGNVPRRCRATIVLESAGGGGLITEGTVVWCRKVRGCDAPAHEIGIQFDQPVDVSGFIRPDLAEPDATAA